MLYLIIVLMNQFNVETVMVRYVFIIIVLIH